MRTITGLHLLALKKAKIYLYGVQKSFQFLYPLHVTYPQYSSTNMNI